ncbi:hypothetical protein [Pseudomonas sp. NPDC096950]|uniref:hypothetical protein n=1 Tax=Pseudomonas sp. NPDC096950 TaxID=3364485 RepID=UPI00383B225F
MVEITELPPDELPKSLTARHVIQGLGEHLTAFLAANNMTGWQVAEDYVLRDDHLGDQLLLISQSTGLYVVRLKRIAKYLTKVARANGAEIQLANVQEMLARALGYSGYHIAVHCRTVDDFIENIWPAGAAMSLTTLNEEAGLPMNPELMDRLRERIKFNEKRDLLQSQIEDPISAKKLKIELRKRDRPKGWAPVISRDGE